MVRKAGLATLLLVTVLSGCGTAATPGGAQVTLAPATGAPDGPVRSGPALPGYAGSDCPKEAGLANLFPAAPPPAEPGPVPDGFTPTWVLRCRTEVRDLPGQGQWNVVVTERADTAATELVEQLRRPSDPRTAEACTLELVVPPYFLLVDAAATAILPEVPTDICGKPRREVLELVNSLEYRTLAEAPVAQVRSPESVESGCSDSYKDVIALGHVGRAAPADPAHPLWPEPTPATVQVCVYGQISAGELPAGTLTRGHTLDGDAASGLLAALRTAGPAAQCSTPHTGFAVLTVPGFSQPALVELDGCHRLVRPDNSLGQLDAATVAPIVR